MSWRRRTSTVKPSLGSRRTAITDAVGYANPNKDATALVSKDIAEDPGIYPPAEVLAKLVDPKSLPEAMQRQRVRAWTAIKSGR